MKRSISITIAAAAILSALAAWRSLPPRPAEIPKQEKTPSAPAQATSRELPYQTIAEITAWLKAGGGADARALHIYYDRLETTAPAEDLLKLILEDFPPEQRARYVSQLIQNETRRNPLKATPLLDLLPPGSLLTASIERIAYQSATLGEKYDDVIGWIGKLDFPEDRKEAYRTYFRTKDWSADSLESFTRKVESLPPEDQKTAMFRWLVQSKEAQKIRDMKSGAPGTNPILAALIETNKLIVPEAEASAYHPPPVKTESQILSEKLRLQGTNAYAPAVADRGYGKLLQSLGETPSPQNEQAVAAWYLRSLSQDPSYAVRIFPTNPSLHTEDLTRMLVEHLLRTDQKVMRQMLEDNTLPPQTTAAATITWLEDDPQSASAWLNSLPAGEKKTATTESMIEWLDKKGDKDGANQWRATLGK